MSGLDFSQTFLQLGRVEAGRPCKRVRYSNWRAGYITGYRSWAFSTALRMAGGTLTPVSPLNVDREKTLHLQSCPADCGCKGFALAVTEEQHL